MVPSPSARSRGVARWAAARARLRDEWRAAERGDASRVPGRAPSPPWAPMISGWMPSAPSRLVHFAEMRLRLALCCLATFATSAAAEGSRVLWARSCDFTAATCGGAWQRRQVFEAERWCRAARTFAVNQALTPEGRQAAWAKGSVVEYQCLPDTVDPRVPRGK